MTNPNPQPAALEILTDLEAVQVLATHWRRDISGCGCGWGVDAGDMGKSHSLHVWRELQRKVLPAYARQIRIETAERIARAIEVADRYVDVTPAEMARTARACAEPEADQDG